MKILRFLCLLLIGLFFSMDAYVFAQTQSPINWYYGNSGNGFRFVRPTYVAEAATTPNTLGTGMSAVATEPTSGVLLFYTDGVTVYNRENAVMVNGNGLNGNQTVNQGVAISANPASADQYYIITNNGTNIFYSTVDMTLDAANAEAIPRGQVINKNQPIPGLGGTYDPGMIILKNANRDGFWLILHPAGGGTNFQVVEISSAGFNALPLSAVTNAPNVVDNFSFNEATGQLAIAAQNNQETIITDFTLSNGLLGAIGTPIPGTASTTQAYNIFDTEWSNDGRYLYLSGNFGAGQDQLMQVDFTESPLQLRPLNVQNLTRSYGLQMAPDSSIYHLYRHSNGTFRTGRIEDADTVAAQARYVANAFGPVNYAGRQFPAFLPPFDPMMMLSFEVAGICATVPSVFLPTIMPSADSVRWDFGDGNGSLELAPLHTYDQGGMFQVGLTAYLNGDSTTVVQSINITQFELSISGFPNQDTVCAEDFPVMYTAEAQSMGTPPTFRWSNQDFDNPMTTVDSAGAYYVTATDGTTGCVAHQSLEVVEYRAIDQRAFIWYFGQNAGIDFNPVFDLDNPGPAEPIPFGDPAIYNGGSRMVAPEGCAIYCDDNGQPLFYSDGVDIFDREGNLMATDIGGSRESTQSVLIVEFPNDGTLFYVFLTREVYDPSGNMSYELNYVIFDLKQNDGLGDLVRDLSDQVIITKLFSRSTERITGTNNWLIAHEWGNNNFRSYPVTGNGIAPAIVSNVGSVHSANSSAPAQGYMKLAPTGKLAVAVSQSNSENYVELFDFDNTTGAISNPLRLDLNENGQVYGVEFSADYRKLFATVRNPNGGGPSKIYRWQIDTTTVADTETDPSFIIASLDLVADEPGEDLGAIQRGPDGQLYVAREGSVNLGIITNPNADLTVVPIPDAGWQLDGFGLGEDLVNGGFTQSRLGLPNFLSQFITSTQEIQLEVNSGCIGESLTFNVLNKQSLETYRWTIFDSDSITVATGVGESFDFSSMTPGTYRAYVDVIPDCQIVESMPLPAEALFEIYDEPIVNLTNIIEPSSCGGTDGSVTVEINQDGLFLFEFSGPITFVSDTLTGPVNEVVNNLPGGTYNVYSINALTGCQAADAVTLSDSGVQFNLNASSTDADCSGQNGTTTISIVPDAGYTLGYPVTYVIRPEGSNNGVISGTYDNADGLQTIVVDGLAEGVYNVEVNETSADQCTQTLENIVIGTPPAATLDTDPEVVACDENEAIIPFTTNAPGIRVVDPAPGNFQIVNGELTVFAPGTWVLETVDASGALCPETASVEVIFATSDPLPPSIESSYSICPEDPNPDNRQAVIDPGNAVFTSIEYFDAEGAPITGSGPDYSLVGDVLTVFVPGPVQIEITNSFGCVTRETVDVLLNCAASINAPDAFRPNSPIGENTVWRVYPFLVSPDGYQLFIFNRWGEMIVASQDLQFEWNGGYNNDEGRPVPGGTYAYRIIYNSINNDGSGPQEERGAITVIR